MGSDGRVGAEIARNHGARVVIQDEATSVVWGMPGSVADAGLADAVYSLPDLPAALIRLARIGNPRP
jgi:two-component system chemotaxis response regulator CheB